MKDGRTKNGGAREGAGRKSKADEEDLRRRLGKWKPSDRDRVWKKLFEDAESEITRTRVEARKVLFGYAYGKPSQRVIIEDERPDEPKPIYDLSQLKTEELEILERAGDILAKARRGEGGEGSA